MYLIINKPTGNIASFFREELLKKEGESTIQIYINKTHDGKITLLKNKEDEKDYLINFKEYKYELIKHNPISDASQSQFEKGFSEKIPTNLKLYLEKIFKIEKEPNFSFENDGHNNFKYSFKRTFINDDYTERRFK